MEELLTNLYEETEDILKDYNKTWDDIKFIIINPSDKLFLPNGIRFSLYDKLDELLDVEAFKEAAKQINYDSSWGCVFIDMTLKIVGRDWWLERFEYDGNEKWVFKSKPKLKKSLEVIEDIEAIKQLIYPQRNKNNEAIEKT